MPITFRMTALERKPLVIIYNENINIADIYKRYGYQLPEILSDTKAILASSGLPANSTVIFANKRTEQRYKDPTMVNILEMLEKAGIQLDNDAFKHFQDLLNFPAEIAAEAAVAQEAGLTEEEFYFEKFQDGDRISPLLPGLQQYLERQENQRGRTKPTVIINNDNNMAATESKSKFDLQHAKDNFGVMQAYINAIFEETPWLAAKERRREARRLRLEAIPYH